MKKMLILFAACFLALESSAQEQTDSSKTLNDVIVKETFEICVDEEKLPVVLKSDFSDIIKVPERIHWASMNITNLELEQKGWDLFPLNLSTPEYANIHPQPAKVFYAQFKKLTNWKLDIFASNGSLFRTISGEGNPPESIDWDGKGNNSEPLIPGHNYSYSLIAVDKAGNKRTFPGQTFSVSAIYMLDGDSLWIGIASSIIFSADGFGLLNSAEDFAKEISGLIRYYSHKGNIYVEAVHPQKNEFLNLIAKNLGKDLSFFQQISAKEPNSRSIVFWIE